jgi:hypothetical protein
LAVGRLGVEQYRKDPVLSKVDASRPILAPWQPALIPGFAAGH